MKKIMKKLFMLSILVLLCVLLLQSCYAFLQADKLVYSGNVFKKPADMHVEVLNDTVQVDILK